MPKLDSIDAKVFEHACEDARAKSSSVEYFLASLQFGNPKTLKSVCYATFAVVSGSKFHSIKGVVEIKASMEKCVQYMQSFGDFDSSAPKDYRRGRLCCYNYYLNSAQKAAHDYQRAGTPVDGAQYVGYYIVESPSSLVAHREFVFVDTTRDVSAGGKARWLIYDQSADFQEKFTDIKVVRGNTTNVTIFEQEDGFVRVTSWVHADPCGSVPALLFNHLLDDQMDFIIDMKRDLEK